MRAQKYVKADRDVTRHIVDLSAPILNKEGVAAALTCPYIQTPAAIPIKNTVAAIRRTAVVKAMRKLFRP